MISQPETIYDIIIIGGGASGMIAAGRAGEIGKQLGKKVLLIEKNKVLGKKLGITGGGRCNITNNERDVRKFLAHYGKAEQFLYSAFSQFGVNDTFTFFEGRGLPLSIQARNRVFPSTEKAKDVCKVLEKYMQENHVEVLTNTAVTNLEIIDNTIVSVLLENGKKIIGKSYILATGGLSHPETGSTGDGFMWLTPTHTISKPTPNIVPLIVEEQWVKDLAGISFEHIKITFYIDGKKKFSKDTNTAGKLLCTHFGLSGPLALNSSKQVSDLLYEGIVTATIDCYPDKNLGELETYMIDIFDKNKNKDIKNVFADISPTGTSKIILGLLPHIDPATKVNSITKDARKELVRLLKSLPVTITGLMGFDRAVVADGGLDISEIDTKTMQSKKIKNLYVTGDILDIERPSGGYSLQLCWTTGFVAGTHA
jgi:predicted Rossmann fold flavoprotein